MVFAVCRESGLDMHEKQLSGCHAIMFERGSTLVVIMEDHCQKDLRYTQTLYTYLLLNTKINPVYYHRPRWVRVCIRVSV